MSLCIVRHRQVVGQCDQFFNFVRSSLVREVTLNAKNIRQLQTAVNQSTVPEAIGIPIDMLGDISN
jgi:hypothetical protein